VFNSQIAAACQTIPGYIAIEELLFFREDKNIFEASQIHLVTEGSYFDLDPSNVYLLTQVAANG
jgi:hypothetical protein